MSKNEKKIRVWADGCFDMVHYGHANFLRQCSMLGDTLVVGVHSDEEISANKGPPVFTAAERLRIARAIKWVDEVYENAPLTTCVETIDKYNCDFCVHGDDLSINAQGVDTFATVKAAGRYREVKRTAGVSTTDLVGRMLLATKSHFNQSSDPSRDENHQTRVRTFSNANANEKKSPWTGVHQFLQTTNQIVQFSPGKEPQPNDTIVYVSGSFDLFHVGHVDFLEKVSKLYPSTFVIVGLHTDQEVNRYRGENHPIMNLHERTLSVLACRYVSEVVIGAPLTVDDQMIKHFKIDLVVHGSTEQQLNEQRQNPFECAKKLGKFKVIDSGNNMNTDIIIDRIIKNRQVYIERNKKKEKREIDAFEAHAKRQKN